MDFIKAEIERKRKALAENGLCKGKKYFKRSELRMKEEDMYAASIQAKETSAPEEKSQDTAENLLSRFEQDRHDKEKDQMMPRDQVIRNFRERSQPIRLFGETDFDSYQRLKRVQLLEPETNGLRNDLQAAMDKVEGAGEEDVHKKHFIDFDDSSADVEIRDHVLGEEEISKMKTILAYYVAKREGTAEDDATKAVITISKTKPQFHTKEEEEAHERKEKDIASANVLQYLKFLLTRWGDELNRRSREVKLSYPGKMASATYTQTVEYVLPLFRQLKRRTCTMDILDSLVKIVVLLIDRNYIKANDAYLELAIGNAPWPLGVTNHGIHSRTAQEKIHAKNVAHVLNDETQRKYIQAIKRLMTRAQEFFPTDPSKCVNYMGRAV